jgi:hypothetical protein
MLLFQDPDDRYGWCDTRFNRRILIRFTNHLLLLGHIQTNLPKYHAQIHLFLPDFQCPLIDTFQPQFNGFLKYIYCRDQQAVDLIENRYGRRADHKVFTINHLDFHLHHVTTELLYLLSQNAPDGSNDRNQFATIAMEELDMLGHLLKQLRDDQPADQPVEY